MRQHVAPALEADARRLVDEIAVIDVAARHVALQRDEDERHEDQHDADGGAHGEIAADFGGIGGEGFGGEHRIAAAEQARRAEIGDGEDEH